MDEGEHVPLLSKGRFKGYNKVMEWKGSYKEVKGKLKGQMFCNFYMGKSNVSLTSKWSKTMITSL
jgi:hypothetical protein